MSSSPHAREDLALIGNPALKWGVGLSVLFVLSSMLPPLHLFSSVEPYLALHTALEFFAIAVAAMVFALGWNLRASERGGPLAWLGGIFLAVALLDFFHTLSYQGMPVFVTPSSPEKAIQFWLFARLFAAVGLLGFVLLPQTGWTSRRTLLVTGTAVLLALLCTWVVLFHPERLPRTFEAGKGVTDFKVVSEYILATVYGMTAVLLWRRTQRGAERSLYWLAAAAWTLGLAELYFTLYMQVSDTFNVLGHLYKFAAFAMIYRALFVSGVREPNEALARERALLRALIDSVPDLIAFKDAEGRYLGCNKAFAECYGISQEKLLGRTESEAFGQGLLGGASMHEHSVGADPNRHEEWVQAADGSMRLLDTLCTPYRSAHGEWLGEIRVSRDFTERRRVREQIAEREQRLMMALEGASLGLWDWNVATGKALFSPLWGAMLGYEAEELAPHISTWEALVHPEDWRDIRAALEPHLRGETDAYRAEYRLLHKNGHWVWVMGAGRVLERGSGGEPLRAVGVQQDISQRKAMEESLLQLATSDPLTGLWNRRHFTEVVSGELGRVRRKQSEAAMLLLDLDFFKRVNDTHGHAAGDEVLRHFVLTVNAHLREADVFARLGGEEFAILLPCIDAVSAVRAADRLRDLVENSPAQLPGGPLAFTVSIGASMLEPGDEGFDTVFARADEALYAAKHAGRNRVVLADSKKTGTSPCGEVPASVRPDAD